MIDASEALGELLKDDDDDDENDVFEFSSDEESSVASGSVDKNDDKDNNNNKKKNVDHMKADVTVKDSKNIARATSVPGSPQKSAKKLISSSKGKYTL